MPFSEHSEDLSGPAPKQRRCRRSEAEPHAPPGLSPQVTGGGLTGFLKGPIRAAPERQRGPRRGTEAAQVPPQRSGAACPTGAVTAGDWGWTVRISFRNPDINDKILIFNIILLNINSSN